MKFFGVLFIIAGIMVILGSFFFAPNVYQFAFVPDPIPVAHPAAPQVSGAVNYSSSASNVALWFVLGSFFVGFVLIGQGALFYNIGDINEKIDILLRDD